jgi:predicted ArsR family transcriptional regulator
MHHPQLKVEVLACLAEGANTSQDIADMLAISRYHATIALSKLTRQGRVRNTRRRIPREPGQSGRPLTVYEPANLKGS